jgi:tetratricopeptide (TPR) repeat protein
MIRKASAVVLALCGLAATLALQSTPTPPRANAQSRALTVREDAYRANNLGVAYLEQYNFGAASAQFKQALQLEPGLAIARLNLGIALFYSGDADAARRELEAVRPNLADRPHPDYVLGLIARAADRTEDAVDAFRRVQRMDPADVGAAINLGQLYLQQRKYAEALEAFRAAAETEPYNATAAYGLATALIRSGAAQDGRAAMERFQQLRDSNYSTTFSQNYLEQGRYAEAVASTGAESELVDERLPEVAFADATASVLAGTSPRTPAATSGGAVALFDLDGDGDLDMADGDPAGFRLLRNDDGRLSNISDASFGALSLPATMGIAAGDYNNDDKVDLLVLRAGGAALYRQEGTGRFVDATAEAGLGQLGDPPRAAAWLDADHDGDLDLLVTVSTDGRGSPVRLLRNAGNGRFSDVTAESKLVVPRPVIAAVPTDYDNRRDIDVLLVALSGPPFLFRNLRDGSFRDVAGEVGLRFEGDAMAAAIGDVNKDGYPDFFFGNREGPGRVAASDGRGRFDVESLPTTTAGALAAQFMDYDNDGLLDLFVVTASGPRMLRNLGRRWQDVTPRAFPAALAGPVGESASLASGDLDGDGDVDMVVRGRDGAAVWRNDGGSRSRSLRVRLTSRVSNRSAVSAKIEVRAGSLRQRLETYAATPAPAPADALFGFGDRPGADVVRVLWPSGILQAETTAGQSAAPLAGTLKIEELDRKPSSCPYLYTWNGDRFVFVTDFLGGGEMGYWEAPGVRSHPDPDEYVRIEESELRPRNGRYELRVTNELEEALFLDRVQLVAVAHPADVAVYPNEGLRATRAPFRLSRTRETRPLVAAEDEHGHDVRDLVSRIDRRYPDDFALEPIRGYAAEHSLTITLPSSPTGRRLLLLTGWTDYAFSGDNVAAHQMGLRLRPPALQIDGHRRTQQDTDSGHRRTQKNTDLSHRMTQKNTDSDHRKTQRNTDLSHRKTQKNTDISHRHIQKNTNQESWRTVIEDIGFPVGRPQTFPVDLTGRVPATASRVRIVTNMRVYWDRVLVDTSDQRGAVRLTRLDPVSAELRWRGFSAQVPAVGRSPFGYSYEDVTPFSPWKLLPGRYTREGDVRDLVVRTDDRFAISRPGDEIALSFDATALQALPDGWTRTFLLYADGFSKEMDLNSSSPDQLAPLPFHGMKRYPYAPGEAPRQTIAQRADRQRYHTRIVKRAIPPIELSIASR